MPAEPPVPNKDMLNIAVTYAWNWTDSYTKSFIQVLNFHLIVSAFVVTAYVTAIVNRVNMLAVVMAAGAALAALVVLAIQRRYKRHIQLGEEALAELEKVRAGELGTDTLRLAYRRRSGDGPFVRRIDLLTFLGTAAWWSVAMVYALLRI
jgi:hypothetical protein